MKSEKTCKGCTKETGRYPGCHAVCPKYKASEAANKERKEAERRENVVRRYIAEEVKKAKNSSRRKPKMRGDFNG